MKKILFASTALVAAGLMTAGTASASEKIKLNLGGFSKWWVVGAWADNNYANGATATANSNTADFNSVDIKGDNEIHFGGSTTLDNGMKVGIQIEMEAGGHTDQTTDVIDESYIFVETGFGKFIVGSENNGTYLLHVQAPDAAGNWGEGGIMTGGAALQKPAQVSSITPSLTNGVGTMRANDNNNNTTAIVTDNDADKITYVAPTFYGLTLGASYVPNTTEDNRGATNLQGTSAGVAAGGTLAASEIWGVGGLYANTFGGVGVKLSGGWVHYDLEYGLNSATASAAPGADLKTGVTEWSTGLNLSYAGFTLGGSYRKVDGDEAIARTTSALNATGFGAGVGGIDVDGFAYDVGLSYASGPYAVSLSYFKSSVEGRTDIANKDEITFWQASGKYTLGAGVDALASVGYAKFDDETDKATGGDLNHNDGWTVMTGLGLTF